MNRLDEINKRLKEINALISPLHDEIGNLENEKYLLEAQGLRDAVVDISWVYNKVYAWKKGGDYSLQLVAKQPSYDLKDIAEKVGDGFYHGSRQISERMELILSDSDLFLNVRGDNPDHLLDLLEGYDINWDGLVKKADNLHAEFMRYQTLVYKIHQRERGIK